MKSAFPILVAILAFFHDHASATPPNILLIYMDNVGYGDLACYGHPVNKTPHLDQLARDGVRCTSFYVSTSSCTPSRGALLTGRHPLRNGLSHQLASAENQNGVGLPHRERLLPQYLKPAGYSTACFGKWNIGFATGSRPTERGFDEFLGFRSGNIHYYKHLYAGQPDLFKGTEPLDRRGEYATDLFADEAIGFIHRHAEKPWFVYLPFNAVHFVSGTNTEPGEKPQWQVPAKYLEHYGYAADESDPKKRFQAVLTALDDAIGRVLAAVDELRLRERTLVICISDNGAFMLRDRGLEVQSNSPLRDGGTTAYEGGVRVPAIFRWPGKIKPGTTCHEMLSHLDVLPLCLTAASLSLPQDRVLDGRNPLPTLQGEAPSPHAQLAFSYAGSKALILGSMKIVRLKPSAPWELYDLATDPSETHNLATERSQDVKRLVDAITHWDLVVKNDASEPVPFPAVKKKN